jgi:tetratricopeptide (TPR) repeat protein
MKIRIISYLFLLTGFTAVADQDSLKDVNKAAAIAYNYCAVSLTKINESRDILTCNQEIENVVNNLNLRKVADEELKLTFKTVMAFAQDVQVSEKDEAFIDESYSIEMKKSFYGAFPDPLVLLTSDPLVLTLNAVQMVGGTYLNFEERKLKGELDLRQKKWNLEKSVCEDLEYARNVFIDTAYGVFKDRDIPDSYRLTEKQIVAFLEDASVEDVATKYKRLSLKKADFNAYPPFWYILGKTAYELGRTEEGLSYFQKFDEMHEGILRNDPFAVGVSMTRIAILISDPQTEESLSTIKSDLTRIKDNSWDTDWGNFLYCALVHGELDQYEEALRSIERNKIYYSKLTEEAQKITNDTELSIVTKKKDIERLKKMLGDESNRKVYDFLYVYAACPQIREINQLLDEKQFVLKQTKYVGMDARKWLSTSLVAYFPLSWISDNTTMTLSIQDEKYACESIQQINKTGKYEAAFTIKKMPETQPSVTLTFIDPKISVSLIFEPIFATTPKGEDEFSHYFMKEVRFNNEQYRFNHETGLYCEI